MMIIFNHDISDGTVMDITIITAMKNGKMTVF